MSGGGAGSRIDVHDPRVVAAIDRYWRTNLRLMAVLLFVWAAVGLGCGVLLADVLNQYRLGGFPLGFWFAQQGSIITFVLLILVYALALNRMDDRHHRELVALRRAGPPGTPATGGRALRKSETATGGAKRGPGTPAPGTPATAGRALRKSETATGGAKRGPGTPAPGTPDTGGRALRKSERSGDGGDPA